MNIRGEIVSDHPGIRELHRAAFGREAEADLVDALRSDGLFVASLVAVGADEILGHVLFTRLHVEMDGRTVRAVALAPLGVSPRWQRRGIGSQLVQFGLAALPASGVEAVVVLGSPSYYPRFGFRPGLTHNFAAPFAGWPAFMALEFSPHVLAGAKGFIKYPRAFGLGGAIAD